MWLYMFDHTYAMENWVVCGFFWRYLHKNIIKQIKMTLYIGFLRMLIIMLLVKVANNS